MKRKITAIMLALIMTVALFPAVPVYAAGELTLGTGANDACIYANGNAIIIDKVSDAYPDLSNIYLDNGTIGTYEAGTDTLVNLSLLGLTPVNGGYDLSLYFVFGGKGSTALLTGDTNITMLGGNVSVLYGGGEFYDVTGDTHITISGGTAGYVYGGSGYANVNGNTNITISGGTVQWTTTGGSDSGDVTGSTNVTITGGTFHAIVGGTDSGNDAASTLSTNVTISGGTFSNHITAAGASSNALNLNGNANLTISGGTFIGYGSIYGGTFNGTISGSAITTISGGTFNGAIYGGSRNGDITGSANTIISGGTFNNTISGACAGGVVAGTKNIRISGGSINSTVTGYDAGKLTNANGTKPAYKTTLMLAGISAITDVSGSLTLGGAASGYGLTDVKTTNTGLLTFYIPTGAAIATYDSDNYEATVASNHNNAFAIISSNAGLSSVAALTDASQGAQSGVDADHAIAWELNVANTKSTIALGDIVVAENASFQLYSDATFTTEITGASTLPLVVGDTVAYIKVRAQDTTTVKHYAVTITRAADTTAPTLNLTSSSSVATTSADINFTSDEAGTYYYLVYAAADAVPSAATIKEQGVAVKKGTAAALAAANSLNISGLTAATSYKAYVIVKDAAENTSAVSTIAFTTLVPSITASNITMTAPVAGATPQTVGNVETATSNSDYTVSGVTWNQAMTAGGKFKAGTSYTATIGLTSKNAKEFQSAAFTPTVAGSASVGTTTTTGTGTGNTVSFTVTYAPTAALTVGSISVTTQPTKLTYTETADGVLALNGMIVTATNNDGTTTAAVFTDGTAAGYTASPTNGSTLTVAGNNGHSVTITHTASGRTTTTATLTVVANSAKAITAFNFNGLTPNVTGTVNEGAKTIALTVPYGTDVTALVPTITHSGVSITSNSGIAQNFTSPVTYTVTAANSSTQAYIVTVTVASNGGSGGGSGGGSSPATSIINTNTGSVTGNQLNNAADAAKNGGTVTIKSDKTNEVNLPNSGLNSLAGKNNSLTVVTENGTLTFDSKSVAAIGTQATATDIKVIVDDVVKTTLTEDQQTKVGDKTVYDLSVMSGGKLISSFHGGKVNVSIPYELKAGETADNVTVWYMADDGSLTEIKCTYDAKSKSVAFVVDHFSKYIIGQDALAGWVNPFTDVKSSAWYYNAAAFVNGNGLMNGQTATTFGPQTPMTRGMFVTILGRMEGIDTSLYVSKNTFSDVKSNQYDAPYIAWAIDKGIVTGMGGDKFAPNAAVTREQMAVMMTNYMKLKGQVPTGEWAIQVAYSDLGQVSSWADEAVMFMTMKDLMNGMGNDAKGNPLFAPKSTSTRAQTAQVIMRLGELIK